MNKTRLCILFFAGAMCVPAKLLAQNNQLPDPLLKIYRETPPKINDLVHTKLDVHFDYQKHYLYGKEWVTIKPHAYPTDSLRLDAKGMDIKNISIVKNGVLSPLKFKYDSLTLAITLDKKYNNSETYQVYIAYTAKPDGLKAKGSAAINDAKGLYFINSDGADPSKPIQIWTQGESESSSAWFPTIDKPNQKTTDEITMTVPAKYVTLSNGRLASQKANTDGTRTDTWKMELPHAPYLFMMAVGDFKIYKDKWRDKEVSYYLEPKYAPYAKEIFGFTPEVMEFYSQKLGIDYPWNKYAQIVVRDYVSGAMENTTATLHGEQVQATARELIDGKPESETDIVHELFHQWFGDYVTTESWSNLTVNESFADFSETLWAEHKHGQDAGDDHNYQAMQQYLSNLDAANKPLVRFHYEDKEDVFDVVTYQKGGRILNMLRNYLGEDIFFKGLHIYLSQNAFKTGEAQQLRLALEEASGLDLSWFFNQWYYRPGHPLLNVSYGWDEAAKTQTVYLKQSQDGDAFVLPMAIDIYAGGKKERYKVWMKSKSDTLTFKTALRPDLVNIDADRVILAKKTDSKTLDQLAFQYFNAPLYGDRFEAIDSADRQQELGNPAAQKILLAALKDKYAGLRIKAISAINLSNPTVRNAALPILTDLIKNDEKTLVKAAAIDALVPLHNFDNLPLFKAAIGSQSYAIQAAALTGIGTLDPADALKIAKDFEKDNNDALAEAIVALYIHNGGNAEFPFISQTFKKAGVQLKFNMLRDYVKMLGRINDTETVKESVADLKAMAIRYKTYNVNPYLIQMLEDVKKDKSTLAKDTASPVKEQLIIQTDYISTVINEIKKL
ncbi:M1 family metallopeptidase [Mucilaginibacter paludis]|uniref:Aminopeptidase N n=1 Tax=Mucilaginibacter paludis DSM 18603 TaxID=714943 RepID=H1YHC3_9SPHI|nr:M1 family metallopeptidase [Mucilaginibacter paludis]EHQ25457.1 Peptidase M1 membrane alanine aminopeptidase [Mucilaginibacter paludis DSM 18603]